jgi:transposase-like protein
MMPESHPLPDYINVQIQRPTCPRCQAHMMLARIMPARLGFDLHIFKCPKCDHVHEAMVTTEAFGKSFRSPV